MTQTGKKALPDSRKTLRVAIKTDSGIETKDNVADIAEVAEMIGGSIFGTSGVWKMWHEQAGVVKQYVADSPWTTPPNDVAHIRYKDGDRWLRQSRGGRIKRLKKPDL